MGLFRGENCLMKSLSLSKTLLTPCLVIFRKIISALTVPVTNNIIKIELMRAFRITFDFETYCLLYDSDIFLRCRRHGSLSFWSSAIIDYGRNSGFY